MSPRLMAGVEDTVALCNAWLISVPLFLDLLVCLRILFGGENMQYHQGGSAQVDLSSKYG